MRGSWPEIEGLTRMKIDFESMVKIVFGGGVFLFFIERLIEFGKKKCLKKRLTKEIAYELIFNELSAELMINDYKQLQKNPTTRLRYHIFFTQAVDSVLSSGYFVKMSFDLVQLIMEFNQRFKNIQYELQSFFKLNDDKKIINLSTLLKKEENAQILLNDLQKSEMFKKLKNKYYQKWLKTRAKDIKERFDIDVS